MDKSRIGVPWGYKLELKGREMIIFFCLFYDLMIRVCI